MRSIIWRGVITSASSEHDAAFDQARTAHTHPKQALYAQIERNDNAAPPKRHQ